MKTTATFAAVVLALICLPAQGFRDDLRAEADSCAPTYTAHSKELRLECHLQQRNLACDGHQDTSAALGEAMQDQGSFRFQRGVQRQRASSHDESPFCALPIESRRLVLREALAEVRVRSESGKDWLMMRLRGAMGEIDSDAMASALETRHRLLIDSPEKRAGLPALPTGWTNLTGYTHASGRVNHLLIHPTTPNTMWLGSDGGGIWKTSDGGTTWAPLNDFLGSLSIANFAMDPANPNIIFAATNPNGSHTYYPFGILRSTDGGATWSQLAATNPATNADWTSVTRIAIHPANGNVLLAATGKGAFASSDGGTSWSKVANLSTAATWVAFHPGNGNLRAVAYDNGTLRYTTTGDLEGGGALTVTMLASGRYPKFVYAPSDTSRLYALVSDSSGNTKFMKSTSGGAAWTDVTNTISPLPNPGYTYPGYSILYNNFYLRYTGALWVDPLNADRVGVAEGWAMFTPNANASVIQRYDLCSGWVDFHGIVAHPGYNGTTNKTVFFMDDGGLYKVTNIDQLNDASGFCASSGFTRMETGATVTQLYSVSGRGGNMIFGAQDVGPRVYRTDSASNDPLQKWRFTARPSSDSSCPGCSWIGDGAITAASRTNPLVLYGSRQYLDFFRSTDGGLTATSIAFGSALNEGRGSSAGNTNAGFIAPFVLDPSNSSRMFAGAYSLWRSNNVDSGNPPTWTSIRGPFVETACGTFTAPVDVIAVAPSDANVVWIAYQCAGRVFKTANALAATPTWTEVLMPSAATFRSKSAILIDAVNPNVVWVGLGTYAANTLFRTTDGGATTGGWTTVAGLPSAPVNALAQHPLQSAFLYAGTGVGLFASADGGATWSTSNEGPANVVIRSLAWYAETATSADLLVGTFGRGAFRGSVVATTVALTVPDAPALTAAAAGDAQATLSFTTPASNGGSAITGYTATCNPSAVSASGAGSPIIVTGLANSTTYSCTVKATNAVGTGAASNAISVTPLASIVTLRFTPTSLDFGGQSMRTTTPALTVTITNGSTAATTVASITASASFAVSHNCAALATGASCTASVTFTPTAQGNISGALTISHLAGSQSVPLAGIGERSLTTHYYRSILRRAPDAAGKTYWDAEAARVQALGASVNETWYAMALSFYGGAEYAAFNRDSNGLVTDLYNTFFNRTPDAGGLAYWTGLIASGMPREVVLASFMFSPEFATFTQAIFGITATRPEIDVVVDFYRGLLGRLPDSGGFTYWLQQFRTAQCQGGAAVNAQVEAISSAYAGSAEYAARGRTAAQYVGDLYNAFLRRGGDLAGVQFWIGQISTGARTREKVRQDFIAQPEFQSRVLAIITRGCFQ